MLGWASSCTRRAGRWGGARCHLACMQGGCAKCKFRTGPSHQIPLCLLGRPQAQSRGEALTRQKQKERLGASPQRSVPPAPPGHHPSTGRLGCPRGKVWKREREREKKRATRPAPHLRQELLELVGHAAREVAEEGEVALPHGRVARARAGQDVCGAGRGGAGRQRGMGQMIGS